MTTMTITDQSANGALQLAIRTLDTVTAVSRSDANGVADVRTLPGVLPWTAPRAEDLRNYCQNVTTATAYNFTRCAMSAQAGNYTRMTADGTGVTYSYYNGYAGGTGAGAGMLPVALGDPLQARIDLKNNYTGTVYARLAWNFYDAAGASVAGSTISGPMVTLAAGGNTGTAVVQGTAPAGAVYARVLLYLFETLAGGSPAAGTHLEFKYLGVYKGPNAWAQGAAFFHGGYADTAVYDYAWAGVSYASESVRYVAGADLILNDFEASSGAVDYTVTGTTEAPLTVSKLWALTGPWLFVPVMPSYSVKLESVLDYSAGGDSLGTVHTLLGRPDPVAVLRGMSTRRGTVRLYCGTFAQAMAVVQATRRGEVLMLRQPEHAGMDMYFTATNYAVPTLETKGTESVFGVDLGYVELSRPAGNLSGSLGWTFAALAASQTSFAKLPKVYKTFQDALLDKRI